MYTVLAKEFKEGQTQELVEFGKRGSRRVFRSAGEIKLGNPFFFLFSDFRLSCWLSPVSKLVSTGRVILRLVLYISLEFTFSSDSHRELSLRLTKEERRLGLWDHKYSTLFLFLFVIGR